MFISILFLSRTPYVEYTFELPQQKKECTKIRIVFFLFLAYLKGKSTIIQLSLIYKC